MDTISAKDPIVADDLKRINYRKRTCFYKKTSSLLPMHLRSYWDGGSRNSFIVIRNGDVIDVPVSGAPVFTSDPLPYIPQEGDRLIQYGVFQGKPATAFITDFVSPED